MAFQFHFTKTFEESVKQICALDTGLLFFTFHGRIMVQASLEMSWADVGLEAVALRVDLSVARGIFAGVAQGNSQGRSWGSSE